MKRPIRETERARKVACASRDDEKKTIDGRWFRSVTGGGTTGQRRRWCAGGSRARETREKSRRDARARGEREPSTACSSRLSRFTGRPRTPRLEGRSFRGRGTARDRRRWERTARRACRCSWQDSTPGGAPPCRTPPPRRSSGDASRPLTAARGCCVAPPETRHAKSTRVVSESAT